MISLKKSGLKENRDNLFFKSRKGSFENRLSKIGLNGRGQVWVETVIYTLIGLAVIGILLAVSKPKIEQMKDKIIIEQTIKSLNEISTRIYDVQIAPGNKRILNLKISKGKFYVNASANKIGWIIESSYKYSQPGKVVDVGNMEILTSDGGPYLVEASMTYGVNLTNDGKDDYISRDGSPTPYMLSIENNGKSSGDQTNVDLVVS